MSISIPLTKGRSKPDLKNNRNFINFSEDYNLRKYIPDYICKLYLERPIKTKIGRFLNLPILFAVKVIKIYVFLLTWNWERCLTESTKKLNQLQIDIHYSKIASHYEERHHIITNWHDTSWRMQIGHDAVKNLQENKKCSQPLVLLDLCTGIGLSLEEVIKVFNSEEIKVKAYGLDYNNEMLKIANEQTLLRIRNPKLLEGVENEINFVRGNATDLIAKDGKKNKLFRFSMNSVDCITNLCGIGGVEEQKLSFEQQLKVLKPGGILIMRDMHCPLPDLNNSGTILSRLSILLRKEIWENITAKLILKKLWAWDDPTLAFYILPLVTYYDCEENKYYGFHTYDFTFKTEPWIFQLPLVSTANIIVKKTEITFKEYTQKEHILKGFNNSN